MCCLAILKTCFATVTACLTEWTQLCGGSPLATPTSSEETGEENECSTCLGCVGNNAAVIVLFIRKIFHFLFFFYAFLEIKVPFWFLKEMFF